jgi:hypothetical protein
MTWAPGYAAGVRVEHEVIHQLTDDGYVCTRAASSKGAADVIAIKQGQVCLVSVKRTTPPGPDERAQLVAVARLLPGVGVPLVALGPPSNVTYRRLTGVGPRDFVAWTPDTVGGTP